ncbi:MAG: UDP-glucose 4-epimerase GalE [Candidatus Babeliales bacterium]|jgi:UDP-glucose-4-epimerase GalE
MKKTILLTGGLGFVGSVTAHVLHALGYQIVIVDKSVHHQPCAMPWAHVFKGDMCNRVVLTSIFAQYDFVAVMHFAGLIEVGQSVIHPDSFYTNNLIGTLTLLDVMHEYQVPHIIFSSSCAVYGIPQYVPLDENHPCDPINPYGRTKHAIEYALKDYASAFDMKFVILRYFNAAGATLEYGLGECHNPESHVIPLLLRAAHHGVSFSIYGADYATCDGTCVRDYVHVHDIARAHVQALEYQMRGGNSEICNLGTGKGYSIYELIDAVQRVSGCSVATKIVARREGDVATLVANAAKARSVLHWQSERSDLDTIVRDAWMWEQQRAKIADESSLLSVCSQ